MISECMDSLLLSEKWMQKALVLAQQAGHTGEVPVGAILVKEGIVLAAASNAALQQGDPTAHAEMLVLRRGAQQLQTHRLHHTTLYVTLEPCLMCVGAIMQWQVQRVVFGAYDTNKGAMGSTVDILSNKSLEWRPDVVGGLLAEESSYLLRKFFKIVRKKGCLPLCYHDEKISQK